MCYKHALPEERSCLALSTHPKGSRNRQTGRSKLSSGIAWRLRFPPCSSALHSLALILPSCASVTRHLSGRAHAFFRKASVIDMSLAARFKPGICVATLTFWKPGCITDVLDRHQEVTRPETQKPHPVHWFISRAHAQLSNSHYRKEEIWHLPLLSADRVQESDEVWDASAASQNEFPFGSGKWWHSFGKTISPSMERKSK